MKKQTISYSWPAILSDFSKDEVQGNFTRGKLKVFYKGETGDHRYFSDGFSESLVKTLPYTPVVSQYDWDEDDFVGHAAEQQIYGIVDPCVEPSFQKDEDGKEWCVCDVVFYTERPDKVGEIAKKIAGHQHSLELDPKTVKYKVNYDEKKHFKNIEFTAGTFVGVSVLGKKQKPAFTGSEFFSENSDFALKMNILKDYVEGNTGKEEINPTQNGGTNMDLHEFMTLSYGEISQKVNEAICKEYEKDAFTYLVDFYEDSAIVQFYYYVEGTCKLMRVQYSCDENGNVTLGGINEVHVTYEDVVAPTIETASSEDGFAAAETEEEDTETVEEKTNEVEGDDEKPACAEEIVVDTEDDTVITEAETVVENTEDDTQISEAEVVVENTEDDTVITEATVVENESTPEFSEESSVVENETSIQEDDSSTTSFAESEREELENLKRDKKINLINSFKDTLTEEQIAEFTQNVDSYESEDTLELALLKAYKNASSVVEKPMRVFNYTNSVNNAQANESGLDALVRKNLKR